MERTPSTPSSGESRKPNIIDALRNPRTAMMAALMTALTACGEETKLTPAEVKKIPECQEPERAKPGAPKVKMSKKGFELRGNQLRVNFAVPKFDEECRAPVTVSVEATVWRSDHQSNAAPSSSVVSLPGRTEMWTSGEGFVDAEVPASFDSMSSFTLVVVDAAGKRFETAPIGLDL